MIYIAVVVVAILAVDWLIVLGINPKRWRGGGKDD